MKKEKIENYIIYIEYVDVERHIEMWHLIVLPKIKDVKYKQIAIEIKQTPTNF